MTPLDVPYPLLKYCAIPGKLNAKKSELILGSTARSGAAKMAGGGGRKPKQPRRGNKRRQGGADSEIEVRGRQSDFEFE